MFKDSYLDWSGFSMTLLFMPMEWVVSLPFALMFGCLALLRMGYTLSCILCLSVLPFGKEVHSAELAGH